MTASILVIDDDEKITAFLRRSLSYEGYQVLVADNACHGLDVFAEEGPDLIILDIMMPGLSGLDACRRFREQGETPILMLTARDDISDRVRGLDAGADDYLPKPFALEELLARVRALLRRRSKGDAVLRYADMELDPGMREASRGGRTITLTAKEYELLLLFMRHPRRVLTRDAIMTAIWGYDFTGESNVLEVYVGYLRQKLESGGEPRLLYTVRGVGYVLRE